MARDKKTETDLEAQALEALMLEDALSSMTDKEVAFWDAMNSGDYTQVEAYKHAYDAENMTIGSISVEASRLWNSPKFTLARGAFTKTVVARSKRSLEERIARMEALKQQCIDSGNMGAAFQCEQALGKLEGHYVEKSENVTKHIDYAETLKQLEKHMPQEAIDVFKERLGLTYAEKIH